MSSLDIRLWQASDMLALEELVFAYLQETAEDSYDVIPSKENAHMLTLFGLMRASVGDPAICVEDPDGKLVGWTCWVGYPCWDGMDLRYNVCVGMGTYVSPEYRRQGVSKQMHEVAVRVARERGYTAIDRFVTLHGHGRTMLARSGWETYGNVMRRRI